MNKLSVKGLAMGIGAVWGVYMLFIGWISAMGYGAGIVNVLASIYIGFKPGFLGGIIGGIFGFIDGAIGGAIIAYVYNLSVSKK